MTAHAQGANRFSAGIERHAHPGEDTFRGGRITTCLAFTRIVLCQNRTAATDDLRRYSLIFWEGRVLALGQAFIILYCKTIVVIIVVLVVERDVKMRGWNDLRRLGVDELQYVVERQRDVHALRYARQCIHFLHTPLQVRNRFYALDGHGGCVSQVFEEHQIARCVGLT